MPDLALSTGLDKLTMPPLSSHDRTHAYTHAHSIRETGRQRDQEAGETDCDLRLARPLWCACVNANIHVHTHVHELCGEVRGVTHTAAEYGDGDNE